MTAFTKLVEDFYISGQIGPVHIGQASTEGIKTIINLRPNGEKPGYLDAEDAADVAEDHDVKYHHLPIPMTGPNPDQVSQFAQIIDACDGPVLAHCGSGKRAAILWALSSKGKISADDILKCCASSGHDLSGLRPHL